jgi:hypothetical protein
MSFFGAPKPAAQGAFGTGGGSFFAPAASQQTQTTTQNPAGGFLTLSTPQPGALGSSVAQPQSQAPQMPVLAQSQAQLSSSLWQPGKETPRMFTSPNPTELLSLLISMKTRNRSQNKYDSFLRSGTLAIQTRLSDTTSTTRLTKP